MKKPFVLAVIPARGGSKGIPGKNLRRVAGKPLLAWTIEHALSARSIDRVVVSTEDPKIAAVARKCGSEVLNRPKALARDNTDTLPVLQHALKACPADILVVLQCTSPIRSKGLIDRCVRKFIRSKADSLGTVYSDRSYEFGVDMPRRQEIKPRLVDNGNVYVNRAELVLEGDRYGRRIAVLETTREESVEIDDWFDLWLAEKILSHRGLSRRRERRAKAAGSGKNG